MAAQKKQKQIRKNLPICNECTESHGEMLRTCAGYFFYFDQEYAVPYHRTDMSENKQCYYCANYTHTNYKQIPPEGRHGLFITEPGWQKPLPGMEFAGSFKV